MDKAVTRQVKRRYPLTTTDLTKPELRKLTEILTLENPPIYQITRADISPRINETIQESIKKLPCALRRSKIVQMMPSHSIGRIAGMCASHNGLNAYVVAHLLDLVRAEVTERLSTLNKHAGDIHPFERKLLRSIQAIGRIWGAGVPADTTEPVIGAPSLQGNKCEVCMLARIAMEPLFLRNLRIALLSRTRTKKKKHRVPRLLRFIDGCIGYHEGYAFRVFHESNQLAIDFKLARKGTVAMGRKRRGRDSCQKSEARGPHEQNTKSIVVYLDPELREQHMHEADEAGHARCKGKASDRDTLADDIIPFYEQISPNEARDPKAGNPRSKDLKETLPTRPSSLKKDPGQASKSKQTLARNIPSREKQDWAKIMKHKSPLDSLTRKLETTGGEGLGFSSTEDADALGAEYRDLLSPRTMYDSESEYSQALSEDDPIQEPSPHGTTWSLVIRDAETPPGKSR